MNIETTIKNMKKITWNLFGVLFWSYILLQLFVLNLDGYINEIINPNINFLVSYKLIVFIAIFAVCLLTMGTKKALLFSSYIIFYPLVFIFKFIGVKIFKNWQLLIVALPAIHDLFVDFRLNFIIYTLAIVSTLIVIKSNQYYPILASVIILASFCVHHNYQRVRNSFGENVFSKISNYIKKINEKVAELIVKIQLEADKNIAIKDQNGESDKNSNSYLSIYMVYSGAGIFTEKIKLKTIKSYDKYLMFIFTYTYFLTLVIFGLVYFGVSKMDADAFIGGANGFLDYLLLSATYLTGSLVEANLKPSEMYIKFICVAESMYMYLFIALLFFTVFTRIRDDYKQSIDDLGLSLDDLLKSVENKVNQTFNVTLDQIEKILYKKSESDKKLVNFMRKQRGFPEIIDINEIET